MPSITVLSRHPEQGTCSLRSDLEPGTHWESQSSIWSWWVMAATLDLAARPCVLLDQWRPFPGLSRQRHTDKAGRLLLPH